MCVPLCSVVSPFSKAFIDVLNIHVLHSLKNHVLLPPNSPDSEWDEVLSVNKLSVWFIPLTLVFGKVRQEKQELKARLDHMDPVLRRGKGVGASWRLVTSRWRV